MNEKKERVTPVYYSRNEELLSAITHGIGALFGVFALVYMVVFSAHNGNAWSVAASAIYGASLIILYTISTLHHALTGRGAKKVFRVLDHATIFLLIAGTYTPIALITLQGALGWTIFGIQWAIAAAGIVLGSVSLNRFKKFSTAIYLTMGWAIIAALYPLVTRMEPAGFIYLLGGGIFYSAGILLYRKKGPYLHFLWHLFSLIGSVLQFVAVCLYVLPTTF
ncbi:MAG: hemolysin III family protein [Clostridia bacterium]|nr:hemolysin III family protein [Clostridia bacterium]